MFTQRLSCNKDSWYAYKGCVKNNLGVAGVSEALIPMGERVSGGWDAGNFDTVVCGSIIHAMINGIERNTGLEETSRQFLADQDPAGFCALLIKRYEAVGPVEKVQAWN